MKRLLVVACFAATSACRVDDHARGPGTTDFYGELAPYGEWVTVAPYGAVWRPSVSVVGPDFYPYYTGGWWVHSEYGWTWQSTWSWGWVPFHHGRWITSSPYGWVWVPGDEWAPAWVEWRVGGGNVGWVPLGPQGVATVFPNYHPRWCFVPLARFGRQNFHHARLPPHQEYVAYRSATAIPFERGDWRRGPSPDLVRRAGGEVPAVPLPAPRTLRPGDVRAERRVGPSALPPPPPAQARQPPPGMGMPSRRSQPPTGTPMPPPPGAPAPMAPARLERPPPPPMQPAAPAQLQRPPPAPMQQRAPAAPPMYRPPPPGRSAPPGSMAPAPSGGGRHRPPGR